MTPNKRGSLADNPHGFSALCSFDWERSILCVYLILRPTILSRPLRKVEKGRKWERAVDGGRELWKVNSVTLGGPGPLQLSDVGSSCPHSSIYWLFMPKWLDLLTYVSAQATKVRCTSLLIWIITPSGVTDRGYMASLRSVLIWVRDSTGPAKMKFFNKSLLSLQNSH